MTGFGGFEEVRRELQQSWRGSLVSLALRQVRMETAGQHEYAVGRDIGTGRSVRAVLSDRRSYSGRPGLRARAGLAGEGGTLVLVDCSRNRVGTFEAFNALPFPAGCPVLVDGTVRVCAPAAREDGVWRQTVQHLRTGRARLCTSYAGVVDAVLAALAEDGPGRAGAVVRGWHAGRGGTMGFEVGRVYDPEARDYLPADPSFDAFLATPDVFVAGLGVPASGEQCMETVSRLMDASPGAVVWEVIPKRSYALGSLAAGAAAMRTGRDASRPYRFDQSSPDLRATGCLPSVVGFTEREGVLWPKIVVPLQAVPPVPEIRVATARVTPSMDRPPAAPCPARAGRGLRAGRQGQPAAAGRADPLFSPDAPPPLPPDLLPRIAAAGPGAPDLGGPDGDGTEDTAADAWTGTGGCGLPRPFGAG
jgi:hypothetical protein